MSVVRKWDSTGKESERGGRGREEGETACGGEEKDEGEEQEDVVVVWAGNGGGGGGGTTTHQLHEKHVCLEEGWYLVRRKYACYTRACGGKKKASTHGGVATRRLNEY